jgi:DNA polymerase-3 subunit delta'
MTHFFGYDAAEATILQAFNADRLHHAWLLTGPRGIGKCNFAWRAAGHLLTQDDGINGAHFNTDPQNVGAKMLAQHNHPDCHYIARGPKDDKEARNKDNDKPFELARNIKVDQIRALQKRFTVRPSFSERRVIIIDSADDMERGSANALLKSLEEPPEKTVFFLISHQPGRLLPTIRSRCITLHFSALTDSEMEMALKAANPDLGAAELAALVRLGKGVPGEALALAGMNMDAIDRLMHGICTTGDKDFRGRVALGQQLTGKPQRERFIAFLRYAPSFAASRIRDIRGDQLPDAVAAWKEICDIAERSIILNLDAQNVAFQIGGLLARLAPRRT